MKVTKKTVFKYNNAFQKLRNTIACFNHIMYSKFNLIA